VPPNSLDATCDTAVLIAPSTVFTVTAVKGV